MPATHRMADGDRDERWVRETLHRYRRPEYARLYKAEYTTGLGPKHLRSRVIAAGERAAIGALLREIDPAGSAVLDVPCGTGKLGPLLHTFPVQIVAADISREMLAFAGEEYDPAQLLRVLQCDAGALPFRDGSVDVVVCLRLFHRLPPEARRTVLREFRRVARGQLLVSYSYVSAVQRIRRIVRTLYAHEPGRVFHVSFRDMVKEIEAAGFRPRKWRYVLPVLSSEIIVRAA